MLTDWGPLWLSKFCLAVLSVLIIVKRAARAAAILSFWEKKVYDAASITGGFAGGEKGVQQFAKTGNVKFEESSK